MQSWNVWVNLILKSAQSCTILLHYNCMCNYTCTCSCILPYTLARTSCAHEVVTVYFNLLYTSMSSIDSPASYHSDHPVWRRQPPYLCCQYQLQHRVLAPASLPADKPTGAPPSEGREGEGSQESEEGGAAQVRHRLLWALHTAAA